MRSKDTNSKYPNAPDLQQILLESPTSQPPHNPYYYEGHHSRGPPPAYSDLAAQATAVERHSHSRPMSQTEYSRFNPEPHRNVPTHIVVQQPTIIRSGRYEVRNAKVRKFNNELIILAIVMGLASLYAYGLYDSRKCIFNFVVHKPAPDKEVKIQDIRDAELNIALSCAVLLFLGLVKCATGHSKTHCCYLFLVGLICFIMTLVSGYIAYISFYTTCSLKIGELASNTFKTVISSISQSELPAPSRGVFGESNVFDFINDDKAGVFIFMINTFNCVSYLALFLGSLSLC